MVKAQSKYTIALSLSLTERITLAICILVICAAFTLMGAYFMFSWLFFLVLITDLVLLVIGKLPDSLKRFTIFISIIFAVLAILFIIASHPWLFQIA